MKHYIVLEADDGDGGELDRDFDKLHEAIIGDGPGSVEVLDEFYVCLIGNPLEGFKVVGPFGSGEEADIWAEAYDRKQRDIGNGNFATSAVVHDVIRDGEKGEVAK